MKLPLTLLFFAFAGVIMAMLWLRTSSPPRRVETPLFSPKDSLPSEEKKGQPPSPQPLPVTLTELKNPYCHGTVPHDFHRPTHRMLLWKYLNALTQKIQPKNHPLFNETQSLLNFSPPATKAPSPETIRDIFGNLDMMNLYELGVRAEIAQRLRHVPLFEIVVTTLETKFPDSPISSLLRCMLYELKQDHGSELECLTGHQDRYSTQPATSLRMGYLQTVLGDLRGAIRSYHNYTQVESRDIPIRQRVNRLKTEWEIIENHERETKGGLNVFFPPHDSLADLKTHFLDETSVLLEEAAEFITYPARQELTIIIFAERADLLAVTCIPQWVGGVFAQILRLPLVERKEGFGFILSSLRHEVLHAQLLFATREKGPAWFHEGAAEQFENPNYTTSELKILESMLTYQTYIPFQSLKGSFTEVQHGPDAGMFYVQAKALVAMLIDKFDEEFFPFAIEYLRSINEPGNLLEHLQKTMPFTEYDLLEYIQEEILTEE